MLKRTIGFLLLAAITGFLLLQLVPYGRHHTNPVVMNEPAWDKLETRTLVQRACFDCHSNESIWPWYSNIAPVSWLVQRDVDEGRRRLNFSEWGTRRQEIRELGEAVQEGSMPPFYFVLLHPAAKLTSSERTALVDGLYASLGVSQGGGGN